MSTDVNTPVAPDSPADPLVPPGTAFGLSVSRIVALLSPFIATVAGLVATWLFVHFPGLHVFGSEAQAVRLIVEGLTFIVVVGTTYAIHHKWLDGLSKWERGVVSDLPGDHSIQMPMMPPEDTFVTDADLNDGSGEPDAPAVAEIPDHDGDTLEGDGKGMPLGWDKEK